MNRNDYKPHPNKKCLTLSSSPSPSLVIDFPSIDNDNGNSPATTTKYIDNEIIIIDQPQEKSISMENSTSTTMTTTKLSMYNPLTTTTTKSLQTEENFTTTKLLFERRRPRRRRRKKLQQPKQRQSSSNNSNYYYHYCYYFDCENGNANNNNDEIDSNFTMLKPNVQQQHRTCWSTSFLLSSSPLLSSLFFSNNSIIKKFIMDEQKNMYHRFSPMIKSLTSMYCSSPFSASSFWDCCRRSKSSSSCLCRHYHNHYRRNHHKNHHHHHHQNHSSSSSSISLLTISITIMALFSLFLNSVQVVAENVSATNIDNHNNNNGTTNSTKNMQLFGGGFLFDPHVQAQCERNLMHITVQFDQPFNGIVHVRNFRRNPCQTYGNGSLITTLTIDLLAHSNRPNYCGVHRVKGTEERSISLVVRLHRALELSDDKHFVITCGNTEFSNRNKNEKLMFKFVDRHGHKITKLYHGEPYRLRAEIIQSSSHENNPTSSSYHLYVRNCFIFNGNDSDVEFLDGDGCPTLTTLTPFKQIGQNIAEAEIMSMFKLPGTNQLHLQCLVELVDNCNFCDQSLCPSAWTNTSEENGGQNGNSTEMVTRRTKDFHRPMSIDMQMLASTTVYVFEPDQQMSHQSIMFAGIGVGGNNLDHLIGQGCTEWRFPWLIALCIMLGILLIIMMVVNIFLCTSMSCSCFKPEIIEHEPTIIEDYDPYKIDIGSYYSPYDSRLSLNRTSIVGGGASSAAAGITSSASHHANNNSISDHQNTELRSGGGGHYYPNQQSHHHHHHHHHKPISMSSSYSPSTENTNLSGGGNHRPGSKLINHNNNGNSNNNNNHHQNKTKPSKNQQVTQSKLHQKSSTSVGLNQKPSITYNPYQHSPQSIRSGEFY